MNFGSRRAPGSPPEAILERFSTLRGAILERFWMDFRALGKLSSELSGLCVGPPSATFFPDTHAREEDTGETQEEHTREEEHARDTGGRRQNQRRNTPELRGIFRTFLAAVSLAPSGPGPGRQQGLQDKRARRHKRTRVHFRVPRLIFLFRALTALRFQ